MNRITLLNETNTKKYSVSVFFLVLVLIKNSRNTPYLIFSFSWFLQSLTINEIEILEMHRFEM